MEPSPLICTSLKLSSYNVKLWGKWEMSFICPLWGEMVVLDENWEERCWWWKLIGAGCGSNALDPCSSYQDLVDLFTKCFSISAVWLRTNSRDFKWLLKKKKKNHNNFPPLNCFHGESITNIFASSFQKFCLFYWKNFIRALQGNKSRELLITWEPVHIHICCFVLFCSLFA